MRRFKALLLTLLSIVAMIAFPYGVGFIANKLTADWGVFSPVVMVSPFAQFGLGIIVILVVMLFAMAVCGIWFIVDSLYLAWYDELEK